jgi:hypothetical protein
MKTRWMTVDTRRLNDGKRCQFDGFVHLLPKAMYTIHEVHMRCWCDPKISWLDEAGTILVSHKNKRPEDEDDDE